MHICISFLFLLRACSRKDRRKLRADSANHSPVCSFSRLGGDGLRVAAAVRAVAFLSVQEIQCGRLRRRDFFAVRFNPNSAFGSTRI